MRAFLSSLNHIPIKYRGPIKKMIHLRPIYLIHVFKTTSIQEDDEVICNKITHQFSRVYMLMWHVTNMLHINTLTTKEALYFILHVVECSFHVGYKWAVANVSIARDKNRGGNNHFCAKIESPLRFHNTLL